MKRIIVSACGAALRRRAARGTGSGEHSPFSQGGCRHGGKIAFNVKFRDGKPKLAGNFDVSGLLVTCDQGNTRRHISTSNVVSVTHRVFSYRFQGFKAKIYGKLNRKGNRSGRER